MPSVSALSPRIQGRLSHLRVYRSACYSRLARRHLLYAQGTTIIKKMLIAASAALATLVPTAASAQSVAPGQSRADYLAWLAQKPENPGQVRSFRAFLTEQRVQDVVPIWQLVRTSSSWQQCSADPFEVAPATQWGNIVQTLGFVKSEVMPAIGKVEALSGFRNDDLNRCSNGKPGSAHRMFFAMDLVPVEGIARGDMISRLCSAHGRKGPEYRTGLGFYSGSRFHVDSNGFRKWGSDGRGATSPCNRGYA